MNTWIFRQRPPLDESIPGPPALTICALREICGRPLRVPGARWPEIAGNQVRLRMDFASAMRSCWKALS